MHSTLDQSVIFPENTQWNSVIRNSDTREFYKAIGVPTIIEHHCNYAIKTDPWVEAFAHLARMWWSLVEASVWGSHWWARAGNDTSLITAWWCVPPADAPPSSQMSQGTVLTRVHTVLCRTPSSLSEGCMICCAHLPPGGPKTSSMTLNWSTWVTK